jgi:hypothetical protein
VTRRPLTPHEIVVRLRDTHDGPERAQLEEWYWALVGEEVGLRKAASWRKEYEWLRAHR